MNNKRGLFLVLIFVLVDCSIVQSSVSTDKPLVYHISMIDLIVRPSDFEGKNISITGYLAGEGGADHFLFLTKEHALLNDISSGFPVFMNGEWASECVNRYVRVDGKFVLDSPNEYAISELSYIWVSRDIDNILVPCAP